MTIWGKHSSVEIFTDRIEDAALEWINIQCDHPAFDGLRIVQMPDAHAGNSCNEGNVIAQLMKKAEQLAEQECFNRKTK